MIKNGKVFIYGRNALFEALTSNPKSVKKVYITDTSANKEILSLLKKSDIQYEITKEKQGAEKRSEQGIIANIDTNGLFQNISIFFKENKITPDTSIVVLDGINDPHNVGAIIRSAVAFGASAVLVPEKGVASITSGVISSSAGMTFKIPLLKSATAVEGITEMKKMGFQIYGLDMNGDVSLHKENFSKPCVFVVGNEGVGIDAKVRKLCDGIVSIKINKNCESLNAAVSVGALLYEWSKQHRKVLE